MAMLAQLLAQQTVGPRMAWAPVVVLLVVAIGLTVAQLALLLLLGASRSGPGKGASYDGGMVRGGTATERVHVRFYVVALLFLVFAVELVFMSPWAAVF